MEMNCKIAVLRDQWVNGKLMIGEVYTDDEE